MAVLSDVDFTAIYRSHHGWLVNWLRQRLDSQDRAFDLAQDTFVRVWSQRRADTPRQPKAYLATIARGLVIDHYRRYELEQAYQQSIAHLLQAEVPSPETRMLILETLYRIDSVLDAFPAATREIFLLSQLDGLTYAQIAASRGISLATVKRHMLRAFQSCITLGGQP